MDWDYLGNMDKTDSTWFHPLWRIPLLTVTIAPLAADWNVFWTFAGHQQPSTAIIYWLIMIRIASSLFDGEHLPRAPEMMNHKKNTHDFYKLIPSPIKNKTGQAWSHLNIHRIYSQNIHPHHNIIHFDPIETHQRSRSTASNQPPEVAMEPAQIRPGSAGGNAIRAWAWKLSSHWMKSNWVVTWPWSIHRSWQMSPA